MTAPPFPPAPPRGPPLFQLGVSGGARPRERTKWGVEAGRRGPELLPAPAAASPPHPAVNASPEPRREEESEGEKEEAQAPLTPTPLGLRDLQ